MSEGAPIRTQGPAASLGTIMERSSPGRRASAFAPLDVPEADLPAAHARARPPELPQVAEIDLVRHYTRLSQQNYGVDTGPYPLGSCTMKYNPKVAETVAAFPGFQRAHPLQPDATVQGTLEMLWRLERALCEVTGMARATMQPPAGACGEMTGLLIMRAFHDDPRATGGARGKVLIPDAAHGTNPASVRLAGFDAVNVPSDDRGLVDVEALRGLVDDDVAGLMLTNPNTLGLFEERIEEITGMLHSAGALVYYDGANLNAIMGKTRPGDMGFDIVHINTHKTFATPHGGGGPGAGPVGVTDRLVEYLPAPIIVRDDGGAFRWDRDRPRSIGRLHGFHGNVGVLVRAYAYVFAHGGDGLTGVSELAVVERELPRRPAQPGLPARLSRCAADARVRLDGLVPQARDGGPSDGCREALDRSRLPPFDGVLPARGRRGDDGGTDGDRVEADPRRHGRCVPAGGTRGAHEPRPSPRSARDHAGSAPRRGEGRPATAIAVGAGR